MSLSIIIPFYKKIKEFKKIFPLNYEIIKKINLETEIVIALDENKSEKELIHFLSDYNELPYTLIINDLDHEWRNPSKAINVGIINSKHKLCLVISPESLLDNNLISEMISKKNHNNFIVGKLKTGLFINDEVDTLHIKETMKHYGSIFFSKQHAINVTGYNEIFRKWGCDDDDFRKRLELSGLEKVEIESGITHYAFENYYDNIKRTNDNFRIYMSNKRIKVNNMWGRDFGRKKVILSKDKNNVVSPDVIHLSYYYGANHSIQKIIDNLSQHMPNSIIHTMNPHNIAPTVDYVNHMKPKIIHLHCNSILTEDFFRDLTYKPKAIVQTIHGYAKSNYSKYIDYIVTINKASQELNLNSLCIENTIHENIKNINYNPIYDSCVTSLRFKKIDIGNLNKFSLLKYPIDIFGLNIRDKDMFTEEIKNINFYYWNNFVEYNIAQRKIYMYYVKDNNPQLSYDMSLMEAAMVGMPIVALERRQDFQKYIIDGYNGYVVNDIDSLISKTNFLIENPDVLNAMILNAQEVKKALKNNMASQYIELYNDILNN